MFPMGRLRQKKNYSPLKTMYQLISPELTTTLRVSKTAEKEAIAALGEEADTEDLKRRDQMLSSKFDAANEEKALVGEEFNQQVRAYNAAREAGE